MTPWRALFIGKGIYNLVVPPALLLLLQPPGDPLYFHGFLALAWVFGYGYCRVGVDLSQNRDIIRMGVAGQAAVCLLVLFHPGIMATAAAALQVGGAVIDGVAAVLFLVFLSRHPAARPAVTA